MKAAKPSKPTKACQAQAPSTPGPTHSLQVGQAYFLRTVTNYYTGRVVAVTDCEVTLEDAAWIADTGRFGDFLTSGNPIEVEPYPHGVTVCRGAIVDYCPWVHALPKVQR